MLQLDNTWWAGISAFTCSQASRPASVSRATLRILGTLVGGAAGLLAVAVPVDDHVAYLLFLACCGLASILGSNCSPHSYAWILGGVTAAMIVTSPLAAPELAVHVATYRSTEIIVGALAAPTKSGPEQTGISNSLDFSRTFELNNRMVSSDRKSIASFGMTGNDKRTLSTWFCLSFRVELIRTSSNSTSLGGIRSAKCF